MPERGKLIWIDKAPTAVGECIHFYATDPVINRRVTGALPIDDILDNSPASDHRQAAAAATLMTHSVLAAMNTLYAGGFGEAVEDAPGVPRYVLLQLRLPPAPVGR